jgi:hypothetical protein
MDNSENPVSYGTQGAEKRNKNQTTQYVEYKWIINTLWKESLNSDGHQFHQ